MRRKDKEITDRKIIDQIFNESQICRIALFDNEYPYIVPFNYGYSENTLYFHSATSGKKIDLIKKNNRVCFEIEHASEIIKNELPCQWTMNYRSIIGFGEIEIVHDSEEKKNGLDLIMAHYGHGGKKGSNSSYNPTHVDNIVILKLRIRELSGKQSGD